MKLTRKNVDDVLVQANYMSGDRYTIASALRINQRLGVVVLAPKGDLGEAATMRDLYQNAPNGRYRVLVHEIAVAPTATAEEKKAAVRTAYKQVEERMRPADRPAWLAALVADNVWVHTATFGTKAVAAAFEANAASSRDDLRDFWRVGFERDLAAWVAARGFTPHRRYVLLWAKAGARQAEKAHHFTSILTWRLLQERIARETDIVPVAVGDDIGLRSHPSLVAFWNDGEWKRMCGGKADTRREQLGLWTYLAQNMASISIIGMRSGAIEVPALLGIRTLYLEERHNQQAERMAKWIGKVPTYERQIVEAPPGIKQQIAWREQNLAHVRGPERQHLVNHTAHTGLTKC